MKKNFSWKRILPLFLLIIPFFCYFSTMSISFDDRDSIHFALALDDYNLTKDQPHPPGFPVYISFGKIVHLFIENPLQTLTFLSALFGALSVLAFFYLIREFFSEKIAYLSSIILSITPMFWLLSTQALSDVIALFFLFVSLIYLEKFSKRKRIEHFYLSIILTGLGLGVRLHLGFILVPLITYRAMKDLNLKKGLIGLSILIITISTWLIPLLISQGSEIYIIENKALLTACLKSEGLVPLFGTFTPLNILKKIYESSYYFFISGYGITFSSLNMFEISFLVFFIFLIGHSLRNLSTNNPRTKEIFIGLLPYTVMILLSLPATNPRYFLPLIPLISVVLSKELLRIKKKIYLISFVIAFLLIQTVPLAIYSHTNLAPPEKLTNFIQENYSSNDTIILNSGNLVRHSVYFLKEYNQERYSRGPMFFEGIPLENKTFNHELYLFDNLEKKLPENSTMIIKFTRNPEIHTKHNTVYLYEKNK